MLKTLASLNLKIENWECQLLLSNDTPIHICKEFLFQCGKYIASIEDAIKVQEEQKKAEEAKSLEPEVKEEPKQE